MSIPSLPKITSIVPRAAAPGETSGENDPGDETTAFKRDDPTGAREGQISSSNEKMNLPLEGSAQRGEKTPAPDDSGQDCDDLRRGSEGRHDGGHKIVRNARGSEEPHSAVPELWNIDGTELDMLAKYKLGGQLWYLQSRAREAVQNGKPPSGIPMNDKAREAQKNPDIWRYGESKPSSESSEAQGSKRRSSRASIRWKKAGTQIKMMNKFTEKDARATFRRHRNTVRLNGRRVSFHRSQIKTSIRAFELEQLKNATSDVPWYKNLRVLITAFSTTHKAWLGLQTLFTLCTLVLFPLHIGFLLHSKYQNSSTSVGAFLYCLDVFAMIDMLTVCATSYVDKQENRVRFNLFLATKHYVMSWSFLLDFISIVPVELMLTAPLMSDYDAYAYYLLTFRCLLMRRMFRAYRASGTWQFMSNLEKSSMAQSTAFPIIKLIFALVYISHFLGCVLSLIRDAEGTYEIHMSLGSYMHPNDHSEYMITLYEVIYLLSGESIDRVYTTNERIVVFCYVLVGAVLNAWLFGQVAIGVDGMMRESLGYQAMMHDVHAHMDSLCLTGDTRIQVVSYFDFMWSRNKSGSDRDTFLKRISPSLRAEIALFQHRELISRVDFFRNAPTRFIIDVVMRLQTKLYLPGDFVIREGDFGTEMFFVQSGACECIVNQRTVKVFHDNEFFGEIALLRNEPVRRTATIKSELYSELIVLDKSDFLDCIAIHPKAAKGVYSVMREKIDGYTGSNKRKLSDAAHKDIQKAINAAGDLAEQISKEIDRDRALRSAALRPSTSEDESVISTSEDGIVRRESIMPTQIPKQVKAKHKTSFSTINQEAASDGLTLDEFVFVNAAKWNVPTGELKIFVKDYMARMVED